MSSEKTVSRGRKEKEETVKPVISVKNLYKLYHVGDSVVRALDGVTFSVEEGEFVQAEDIYERRKRMNNTINEWILSLNEQQLRTFVDTLYQVISASQAEDLIEFTSNWKRSMNRVIAALKEVDEQTARILREIVRSLFEIAGAHMRREFSERRSSGKGHGKHKSRRTEESKEVPPTE